MLRRGFLATTSRGEEHLELCDPRGSGVSEGESLAPIGKVRKRGATSNFKWERDERREERPPAIFSREHDR